MGGGSAIKKRPRHVETEGNHMAAPEIIRARLAEIGMTQTALVEKIGTTKQNFSNKMSRDSFSAAELAAIAAAIGLKIVFTDGANDAYTMDYRQ